MRSSVIGLASEDVDPELPLAVEDSGARLLVPVRSLERLLALVPNEAEMIKYGIRTGYHRFTLICRETRDSKSVFHIRHFAPANGIPGDPVTGTLSAQDSPGGSGVAATYYAVDNPSCSPTCIGECTVYSGPFSVSADGKHQLTYFSVDRAGNLEAANFVAVWIDKTPPAITITRPSAGPYLLDQSVTADYRCTDGGSGLATCDGTVPSGSLIDTSSPGTHTFTVDATDNAGNSSELPGHLWNLRAVPPETGEAGR